MTAATAGADPLTSAAADLAALDAAARGGTLNAATALRALTAVRRLAAGLDRAELALSQAARDGGATWAQVATAMGARGRTGAQKRHADLSRRYRRSPMVDTIPESVPAARPSAVKTSRPARASASAPARMTTPRPAAERAPRRARGPVRPPKITARVISEVRYELVRAPDHAESRAWLVMIGGRRAGMVRPTWRGEARRAAWEAVHPSGTVLAATGTGRVIAAGNAGTRDAAAVTLLNVLLREQERR